MKKTVFVCILILVFYSGCNTFENFPFTKETNPKVDVPKATYPMV